MRLLWIATKAPWPPCDGGRLLLAESLAALGARIPGRAGDPRVADAPESLEITLMAPVRRRDLEETEAVLRESCRPRLIATRPRSRLLAWLAATLSGSPYSVTRHLRRGLERAVARELAEGERTGVSYDLVIAEQLQAFAQSAPAAAAGLPRILRAQNVESDLWRQLANASRGVRRTLLLREAARLARAERAAMASASATIALSAEDGERLRRLAPAATAVEVLPPPFPGELESSAQPLAGAPALVLFGSAGWEPNRRAERQFIEEIWPRVHAARPGARLHWFGGKVDGRTLAARPGVVAHRAPATSAEAFPPGAVLVLPLDIASGVRMRLLEAWARGVAVVASPAAASGLDANDGRELLLARGGEEFATAIERLGSMPGLAARLIAGGRARLAADHAPARFAAHFTELAGRLAARASGVGRR